MANPDLPPYIGSRGPTHIQEVPNAPDLGRPPQCAASLAGLSRKGRSEGMHAVYHRVPAVHSAAGSLTERSPDLGSVEVVDVPGEARAEQRPILKLEKTALDWVLEIAGAAAIVVTVALLIPYGDLPDRIPRHFGASGQPDAWGGRSLLMWLAGISVLLYAGLTVLSRFPHRYNYPGPITAENAAQQYRLAGRLLLYIKATVAWVFAYIIHGTIQTARGHADGLGAGFLPVILGVTVVPIVVYLILARRSS